MGRAQLPGLIICSSFRMKKVEVRLGSRCGLTRVAEGTVDLGGKGGLPFSLPPNEEGEAGPLLQHSDFSPRNSGRSDVCRRKEKPHYTTRKVGKTQIEGLFWTFPCDSTGRGKAH